MLRDIVVHVTAGSPGLLEARLAYALRLAAKHGAGLTGLFTRPGFPIAYHYISATVVREHVDSVNREAETARALFEAGLAHAGVTGKWIDVESGTLDAIQRHARIADLLVLAAPGDENDDPVVGQEYGRDMLSHDVMLDLGRPVILLPRNTAPAPSSESIVIGWNGSKEAARAVHDALPVLRKAKSVTVLVAGEGRHHGGPGDELVAHLVGHGVPARLKESDAGDGQAGDLLLEQARAEEADLIVMGAYGYARWREMVFGGATETVLERATIPIFFSH